MLRFSEAQIAAWKVLASSGARFSCLFGGARSGKTVLIIRAIIMRALKAPGSRHGIFRFRQNAVWQSIAGDANATLHAVRRMCFPSLALTPHRMDGFFDLPNGSTIWLGGLDDEARIDKVLGREYSTVYLNEASEIPYRSASTVFTRLAEVRQEIPQRAYIDLNPVGKSHWTHKLFVEGLSPESNAKLAEPEKYVCARLNPADNIDNLSEDFLKSLDALPEKQRKRFLEGVFVDEVEGALWSCENLEANRVTIPWYVDGKLTLDAPPDFSFTRVVVAVDPSGAAGLEDKRSDEIGIVVCGFGVDGRGYILADYSARLAPEQWASRVLFAWEKHQADRIIAEKNFGGDMVRSVIESQANNRGMLGVKIELAVASRGKAVRAEPVAALYEIGKVRHMGRFPDLEDQLISFSAAGYMGPRSPDRADAMIWGISHLMIEEGFNAHVWDMFGKALAD